MCECEYGKCDICGATDVLLARKYYYYDVDCECCVHNKRNSREKHFEIVRYCNNCKPKPPRRISAVIKPIDYMEVEE